MLKPSFRYTKNTHTPIGILYPWGYGYVNRIAEDNLKILDKIAFLIAGLGFVENMVLERFVVGGNVKTGKV
jgi:hypothetical protein